MLYKFQGIHCLSTKLLLEPTHCPYFSHLPNHFFRVKFFSCIFKPIKETVNGKSLTHVDESTRRS